MTTVYIREWGSTGGLAESMRDGTEAPSFGLLTNETKNVPHLWVWGGWGVQMGR